MVLLGGTGTYANTEGEFELQVKRVKNDTLKVQLLGFETKLIPLSSIQNITTILLNPLAEELNEVTITSTKIDYTKSIIIGEPKEGNIGFTSLIGYETCMLIENPKKQIGKLKRVYIDLKKRKDADDIATFNIKFYKYDSVTHIPGDLLYTKNLYVKPKNKNYRLWINVEDLDVMFLKEGICIGVEWINTTEEKQKYAKYGPMFRYTLSQENKGITWSNYHQTGWKDVLTNHEKYKRIDTGILNPMIGIEVLYPTK
ncbi:hypothetical protein Y10_18710 [Neptunitalea sp. Y10]|uniref:Carboxypeptidase-like regulatory domain-containing protein n=1 Tax=Neptunitalea lumnitzerae TaxID=2965509 RepID=A0ABQ5MJE8_9FLAO|nr:hypothetical protein Y10_18710 [Neptunitalea sp. Y10]